MKGRATVRQRTKPGGARRLGLLSACLLLAACAAEKREVGPSPPGSPPSGLSDSRQKLYETNLYQQGEGGRFFRWAGCDSCHTEAAQGAARLTDETWAHGGRIAEIYRSIAEGAPGMPAYGAQLTPQQIWQISGYVKSLPKTPPNMRRRNNAAQQGEPSGPDWQGALQ